MTEQAQALVDLRNDIRNIRRQVAETTEFRGYGPATLGATAGIAVLAGLAQAYWLPDPAAHAAAYVGLWLSTGVVCGGLIVTQMLTRASRLHSGMADAMVWTAVAQFLPAAAAGVILPFVLLHGSRDISMMPGLWQILFSLGVFASCRCLPRAMLGVGAWFLLTGMACLLLGEARALTPMTMAGPYAVGMALVAAIHFRSARALASSDTAEEGDFDEDE